MADEQHILPSEYQRCWGLALLEPTLQEGTLKARRAQFLRLRCMWQLVGGLTASKSKTSLWDNK